MSELPGRKELGRLVLLFGGALVLGIYIIVSMRAIGKQPEAPGGVRAIGARPDDYRPLSDDLKILAMEARARERYCAELGGNLVDAKRHLCDLGPCADAGLRSYQCGLREVVCDDIEDEHQCGLVSKTEVLTP